MRYKVISVSIILDQETNDIEIVRNELKQMFPNKKINLRYEDKGKDDSNQSNIKSL